MAVSTDKGNTDKVKIMATISYLRMSTMEQDIEKNKDEILRLANDKDLGKVHFVEERVSGKVAWKKRKIFGIVNNAQKGDNIVVNELSRLGRNMLECMEILSICMEKGISIYAVKGNWQLDNSIQSKIIAMSFAMAAEIERELMSQRIKEALRVKKAHGVLLGRPKGPGKSKLDKYDLEIKALLANGSTKRFIARRYKVAESTMNNWIRKNCKKGVRDGTI